MAIELITCGSCGAKNASERTTCLSCHASLATPEKSPPPSEIQFRNRPAADPLLERVGRYLKNLTIEQTTKLAIISSALLVGFSVFYYLVVFLPRREEARIELQKQEQIAKDRREEARVELQKQEQIAKEMKEEERLRLLRDEQIANQRQEKLNRDLLDACLTGAYNSYNASWESNCRSLGRGSNCLLPSNRVDILETYHKGLKESCYKRYPLR